MTYREAGVDLEGADRHVASISAAVTSTWDDRVVGGFGGFAAGVRVPDRYRDPVLMMTTDGVGTKLELARRSGLWDGVGFDLVAMCVDDLAAVGATPIGFVDYMAVGALDPERDRAIVASIASACSRARCPLLGGETAEHPGVMEVDAVDLAGSAIGVLESGAQLGPHRVSAGDVVIGLESTNLRSNGFSLVRHVLDDTWDLAALLAPSVIYSADVLEHLESIASAAHITGGGIPGNLPRAVPVDLGIEIDPSTWRPPEIFDRIAGRGVSREEMFATFNMGIGFCLIARPDQVDRLLAGLDAHRARVIGRITEERGFRLK